MQSVHVTCAAASHLNEPNHPTPVQWTLGTSVIVTTVGTGGIEWVGAKDTAQDCIMPRMPPTHTHRGLPAPNVSGANVISAPALACCVYGNVMGKLAKAHGDDGP